MQEWKQPPIAKIYEALGAVADGRVNATSEHTATVTSSSGDKFYTVEWGENFEWITSNDNASFWQGYVGYPIVAVLLKNDVLRFNPKVAEFLKGVEWKKINTKNKNNFEKTVQEVLAGVEQRGTERSVIVEECEKLSVELAKLRLKRPAKRRRPATAASKQEEQTLL